MAGRADHPVLGGDQDQPTARLAHGLLLDHRRDRRAGAEEDAAEIDGHDRVPVLLGRLEQRLGVGAGDRRVGDEDVQAAALARGRDETLDVGGARHVCLDVAAPFAQELAGARAALARALHEVGRDHVRTLVGESQCDRAADAGAGPGDDRDPAVERASAYRTLRRVRIGVIGAGWIAADHVGRIGRTAGVELAAVCDLDAERAGTLAGERPVYTDWRAMLERESPDAVLIATPPLTHRELALDVLGRGIHLYLEKPIARGLEDARAIVEAAERSPAVCAVGYQWRAVEALDALREALAGQQVGLVIGIGTGPTQSRPWFLDRAQGGGNVLERASHIIDLERAVAGEVVEVQAAASAFRSRRAPRAIGATSRMPRRWSCALPAAASAPSRSPGPATSCRRATRSTSSAATPRCISSSILRSR